MCIRDRERSNRSIYEQILAGVEAADPESVIYLCEHDVAYTPSHFAHVPEIKERLDYNQNRYYWAPGQSEYLPARGKWPLSQLVAYREFLIEMVNKSLAAEQPTSEMYHCRTHRFESERPNVDIRHGMNFSGNGRWKKEYYAGVSKLTVKNIGHWGSPHHFSSKLGWSGSEEMLSILARLLRKHYGLKRFRPAPIRVKGFDRIDVAKIINMLGLKKGAEIGVCGGHHSEILCQNIKDCELLCVDAWGNRTKKWYEPAIERLKPYNAEIVRKTSMDAVRDVPLESLDFVYIDADHRFDFVMEDLIAWGRRVRPGGIIAGHDYDRPHRRGVVPAVDIYTKVHRVGEWFLTDQEQENSFFWIK